MSVIGGQNPIVQDGLVYILDFGNVRSYTSGSNSAKSLIYNPVTASFVAPLAGGYSGLAAAYSVRKVVPGYTGPAVEVQSGSATLNIGFDSFGNLNTASIASFAGSGDAFVKTWYDQSGNSNHAIAAVVTKQPKIYSGSQGLVITDSGKPGIRFEGTNGGLSTNLTVNKPFSIFTCFSQFGSGGINTRVLQSSTVNSLISALRASNTVYVDGDVRSSAYATSGQKVLGSLINNNTSSRYYFQGNDITTTTNNNNWGGFSIGSAGGNPTEETNATIHEVLIYNNNQSTNRLPIELNINNYYNAYALTSSTPTIPDLTSNLLKPTTATSLQTNQTFSNFSYNQGNSTIIFTAQTGESVTSIDGGATSILLTSSSVAYTAGNTTNGRQFTASGFNHITLRFSTGSVDCFINGIPVSPANINTIGGIGQNSPLAVGLTSGSLGNLMVYNRLLTSDEIYSIYLQQARRYGLPEQPKPYTTDSSVYTYTQAVGITGSSVISALDAFVVGLKANNLWNKMIAIYPFLGSDTTKTRYNLKDPSLNTTQINYSGSWSASSSGSKNNNTTSYGILSNIKGDYYHPLINSQSIHLSYLSYDTPASGGYLMGVEQLPRLPGDIATPAAAYSVRKVRTAYTGSAMTVRRDFDDLTFDIGFDAQGNLNTGSLLTNMTASGTVTTLPGDYSGLAAAYSLRRVSSPYTGSIIEVRDDTNLYSASIGYNASGDLDTGSLLQFSGTGSNTMYDSYSGLKAAYALRKVVSTYAGSAIEVVAGAVSQSIGFNANGDLDTGSLLTFVGGADAFIKTWYDQSGNNNHATASSNSQQPKIVSLGTILTQSGKPAMLFDGGDRFNMAGLHGQSVLDTYFVTSTSSTKYLYPNVGSGDPYGFVAEAGTGDTSIRGNYGAATLYANGTVFTGSTRNDVYNFLNGYKLVLHQGASTLAFSQYSFGNHSPGWSYSGYLQELIAFTSSQASNRLYIQNNINSYYGIYGIRPSFPPSTNIYVKTWYDQSGNNRHATQTDITRQPLIIENYGILTSSFGRPSVKFDGVDDYLDTATITVTSQSIFSVQQNITGKSIDIIFGSSTTNYYSNNINTQLIATNTSAQDQFTGAYSTSSSVTSYHRDGTDTISNSAYLNGSKLTRTLFGVTNQAADYSDLGGVSPYTFQGFISEFLLYNTYKADVRGPIEDNIYSYYRITRTPYTLASGSGYVIRWYDQSGNNRHATQSVAANQPIVITSGSIFLDRGKPAVYFTGNAGTLLENSSYTLSATNPVTLTVVTNPSSSNNSYAGVFGNNGSNGIMLFDTSTYLLDGVGANSSNTANLTPSLNTSQLLTGIYTTTTTQNSFIFKNSVLEENYTAGGVSRAGGTTLQIGGRTLAGITSRVYRGYVQEAIAYEGALTQSRQPIEQNINSYFNIYTPEAYNLNTNSLSLFSSPTTVAGAANAVASGLTTGGPLGLITVSRTGSSNYTLWKNRVPNRVAISPSIPQTSSLFLNAANLNNALFSSSQNNIAYASVGAGLSDTEASTYYDLVNTFQTSLGRGVSNPGAFITTWDTRISGTGTVTGTSSIALPLNGTQAITASWGDGTTSIISSSAQVDRTHSYATPGVYTVSITGTGQGFQFNAGGDRAKLIDIGQWGSISGSAVNAFYGCFNLIGTAPDPHVLQATNLSFYFREASKFKGYVNNWDTSKVSTLGGVFYRANSFNQDIGSWNVSNVTNMEGMFYQNSIFNNNNSPSINNWNTSKVTNMEGMFNTCPFNQPINDWDVSRVTTFGSMHYRSSFNQPLDKWRFSTSSNISMGAMFLQNSFNQNIGTWNVEKVTDMSAMFYGSSFNNSGSNSINNWRPISCSNFYQMFYNNRSFNQPIGNWPLSASNISSMAEMFAGADTSLRPIFNQDIGSWDVSKVTGTSTTQGFYGMFALNNVFNNSGSNSINNWRFTTSSTVTMANMFNDADAFNQNIGAWNVEKVTSMGSMFFSANAFNNSGSSDINNWRPISCSNFSSMFRGATAFNQPIGNWPLSASNIDMGSMFQSSTFNQPIGSWDTSRVTNLQQTFFSNLSFNQDIGSWNVGNVTNLVNTFRQSNFNNGGSSSINNWNTSNVTDMQLTFAENNAFDQPIGGWNVGKVTTFGQFFYGKSVYSHLHTIYDGWINNKVQPNLSISFNSIKYSGSAAEGRALLTRTYNTASILSYTVDGPHTAITCSANHNVVAGNKVFISGSAFSGANGVQIVHATSSATMLTLALPYDPSMANGGIITGYGWNITDGGVV